MTERPDSADADTRRLLHHAVDDVDPAYALDRIRTRTKAPAMSRTRPWILGALGAAVATAAVVVGVTVLTDTEPTSSDPASSEPAAGPTASASSPAPSTGAEASTPPPSADPEPSESATVTEAVPVYVVGRTPSGLGLFREFQALEGDDTLLSGIDASLNGTPSDPDYFSLWQDLGARVDAAPPSGRDVIVLALSSGGTDLARRPQGMDAVDARMAVQQLVWTATAVEQRDVPVTFEVDGNAPDTLLGIDVTGGVRRGDPMKDLAPVWITGPQDGETVGSSFTVEGQGAFFEATASWQLLDEAGDVVKDGFAMAEECCVQSPYRFQVKNVEPGDYTLRVYAADTSGGESGMAEPEDTKRLTVQ